MTFHQTNAPEPSEIEVIRNGLRRYNVSHLGEYDFEDMFVFAKDENEKIIAGVMGFMVLEALHIDMLWTDENYRGKGIARKLMEMAEESAKNKNCQFIFLDTFSFQALGFYQKLGFELFGEVKGYPRDFDRYFLQKKLS